MMNINSGKRNGEAKQEEGGANPWTGSGSTTTTTRQWGSGIRNPRIVRVSRAFGGKDRHSKVCTVRGLRDRRIRLSVPTAVQLYELQDKLGLNQPSKAVDWLLDATKDEIDKLPPLQMPPPGSNNNNFFSSCSSSSHQFHYPYYTPTTHLSSQFLLDSANPSSTSSSSSALMNKAETNGEAAPDYVNDDGKEDDDGEEDDDKLIKGEREALESPFSAHQNFLQLANQSSSFSTLLNNNNINNNNASGAAASGGGGGGGDFAYNTYLHLESPFNHSFALPQQQQQQGGEDSGQNNAFLSASGVPQLYFCPPVMTMPPAENDQQMRQMNNSNNISPANSLVPTLHLMSSTSREKDNTGGVSSD